MSELLTFAVNDKTWYDMKKFIFGLGILILWGFSLLLILIEIIGIDGLVVPYSAMLTLVDVTYVIAEYRQTYAALVHEYLSVVINNFGISVEVGWVVTAVKIAIVFLLTFVIHRIWRSIFGRKRNLDDESSDTHSLPNARDDGRGSAPSMFKQMATGAVGGYFASRVASNALKKNYQFKVMNSPEGTTGAGYSTNLKCTYEEAMVKAHEMKNQGSVDHVIITEGNKVVGRL